MRQVLIFIAAILGAITPAQAQFSGGGGGSKTNAPPTVAELEKFCDNGNAIACDDLGVRYLNGDGVPKDVKKSAALFQRACDGGDPVGCYDLAESHRFGDGVAKNSAQAAAFYQRGCDGGNANSCAQLAIHYNDGDGVKQDDGKTALYADRSCKGGSGMGCTLLGAVYAEGAPGYPKDLKRAEELFSDSCFSNANFNAAPDTVSKAACTALAKLTGKPACQVSKYQDNAGNSSTTCFDAQLGWKISAAAAPSIVTDTVAVANAAVYAGNAAYESKDFAKAAGQYASACDNGSVAACGKLGEMYFDGQGVAHNGTRAAPLLAKACDGGVAAACVTLGTLYDTGKGVAPNGARAIALYEKAKTIDPTLVLKNQASVLSNPNVAARFVPKTNFCPTFGNFAPATPQQIQMLADAISNDSRSWKSDRYDVGSLQDVCYDKSSRPGIITLQGIYTYNKGQIASVQIDVENNKVNCIRYALSCDTVRTAVLSAYDNAAQANVNQARAVADAIKLDSQSWLTKQYDVGSLNELRVTSVEAGASTVQGNFTYDNGLNQGSISAKLKGNVVQCISLEAYRNAGFEYSKCGSVRTQSRAQASKAYSDALQERRAAWQACVDNYVFREQHDCGSEPSPGFWLGF